MALNPKLEFYKIKLVSITNDYKTFRDFAIDELYQRRPSSDAQIMYKLFDTFISKLTSHIAKDDKIKKQLKLIKTSANIHLEHKPQVDVNRNIIYGVINGGRYGRNGMMSDSSTKSEDASPFDKNQTILRYYYFLLYLPLDHYEGFLIIHSNSKEETITEVFKTYIAKLFKGNYYRKAALFSFCPKSFQEEFERDAIIKSLEFSNSYLDTIFTEDGIKSCIKGYEVKIEIKPKDKTLSLSDKPFIKKIISRLGFIRNNENRDNLTDFKGKRMTLNSKSTNSNNSFDIDDENLEVKPVVYLKERITKFNDDDTPNFDELNSYCQNLFNKEVLPEIRPDLYV